MPGWVKAPPLLAHLHRRSVRRATQAGVVEPESPVLATEPGDERRHAQRRDLYAQPAGRPVALSRRIRDPRRLRRGDRDRLGLHPPCRELVEAYTSSIPHLTYLRENAPASPARATAASKRLGVTSWRSSTTTLRRTTTGRAGSSSRSTTRVWGALAARAVRSSPTASARAGCRTGCSSSRASRASTAREARSSAEWPFGANIAFRREALEDAGGFPEHLGRTGTALLSGEESAAIEAVRERGLARRAPSGRGRRPRRARFALCLALLLAAPLVGRSHARALRGRRGPTLARLLAAAPIRFCCTP